MLFLERVEGLHLGLVLAVLLVKLRVVVLRVFHKLAGDRHDDPVGRDKGQHKHVAVVFDRAVPVPPCRAVRHWDDGAVQPRPVGGHEHRAGKGFPAAFEALVAQQVKDHGVEQVLEMPGLLPGQPVVDCVAAGDASAAALPADVPDVPGHARVGEDGVHQTMRLKA